MRQVLPGNDMSGIAKIFSAKGFFGMYISSLISRPQPKGPQDTII